MSNKIMEAVFMIIQYCSNCIIPSSRPGTVLDSNGCCQACIAAKRKLPTLEYSESSSNLRLKTLMDSQIPPTATRSLCVVPVSGGKDSIYQVQKALDMGFEVVAVNAVPLIETDLRADNINVLKSMGCEVIEYAGNLDWRVKTSRVALRSIGIPNWSQHLLSVTVPFRFAIDNDIRLVLWGENAEYEYGGPEELVSATEMDESWFVARGGLGSLSVDDMESLAEVPLSANRYWRFPDGRELAEAKTAALYLGMFEKWNAIRNLSVAQSVGLRTNSAPLPGSLFDYENLDDGMYLIHDFLKFIKFGFGRCSDQVSILIRKNVLSRDEGRRIAQRLEGFWPTEYLNIRLVDILDTLGMETKEFQQICGRLADKRLFEVDSRGHLICEDDGRISITREFKRALERQFDEV